MVNMKAFGYRKDDEDGPLLHLKEVTLQCAARDLETIIEFLGHVKDLMDKHGEDFGHEHLRDFCKKQNEEWSGTDLIIHGAKVPKSS